MLLSKFKLLGLSGLGFNIAVAVGASMRLGS
jgi:hypothetical protein